MYEGKWTQLWLDYHRIYEGNGIWTTALMGFDVAQVLISNALKEFKKGMNALTGEAVLDVEESAPAGATDVLKLSVSRNDKVPKEGYSIQGSTEGILLEASDENGVLYGVFAILRQIACGKRATDKVNWWVPSLRWHLKSVDYLKAGQT